VRQAPYGGQPVAWSDGAFSLNQSTAEIYRSSKCCVPFDPDAFRLHLNDFRSTCRFKNCNT
jgi:hypothetical protein